MLCFLLQNNKQEFWPLHLPDLNPCKFFLLGMLMIKCVITDLALKMVWKKVFRMRCFHFTSRTSVYHKYVSCVWWLAVIWRKPFPAPYLNMKSSNIILTAANHNTQTLSWGRPEWWQSLYCLLSYNMFWLQRDVWCDYKLYCTIADCDSPGIKRPVSHYVSIIRFVIPVVFIIKLDYSVCTCLTQLYDGRDMYIIYYMKNNYMFRHFTLAIFRLRNEKT